MRANSQETGNISSFANTQSVFSHTHTYKSTADLDEFYVRRIGHRSRKVKDDLNGGCNANHKGFISTMLNNNEALCIYNDRDKSSREFHRQSVLRYPFAYWNYGSEKMHIITTYETILGRIPNDLRATSTVTRTS